MMSFQASSADKNLGIGFATLYMPFIISPGEATCQFGVPITLSSNRNPSVFGQSVTFTAITSSTFPGTATFFDGKTMIGSQALASCTAVQVYCTGSLGTGGIASITISALSSGIHAIRADYKGISDYDVSSSSVLTQMVTSSVSVAVSSNPNPSNFGQTVTFTATAAPSSCTGTIVFLDGNLPNSATIGSGILTGGSAALPISNLSVGSHPIRANYSGDNNCSSAVSAFANTPATLVQVVVPSSAAISLTSSPNPSLSGQTVTFTACGLPVPTSGSVTFVDGAIALATNNNVFSQCSSYGTNVLSVGTHSITARYSGDSSHRSAVISSPRPNR